MNNTNFYIECLELMGYERSIHGWCNFRVDPSYIFQIHNIGDFTIQELIKRDGVMERVVSVLNKEYPNRYYVLEEDAIRILGTFGSDGPQFVMFETAIELAIELGITPHELMGVEG